LEASKRGPDVRPLVSLRRAFQSHALLRVIVEAQAWRMRTASCWLHVFTIMTLARRKIALINTVGGPRDDRAHEDYHQRGALVPLLTVSKPVDGVGSVRVMLALRCFIR
jgi:hypothetical protein